MTIDWRAKDMNYICKNALPKMPTSLLKKLAEHLNQSQAYKIPLQNVTKKAIINSISKTSVKNTHYWASFDYLFKNELSMLRNELNSIKQSIQKLKT